MSGAYDDIIHLPHHVSATRPHMSLENRAAQFTPFKALTGYDDAIEETGRLTGERIELADGAIDALDMKLAMLADLMDEHPHIAVTYFRPDEKKQGGAYVTATGAVKKIDEVERAIVMMNGEKIALADVLDIGSEIFEAIL